MYLKFEVRDVLLERGCLDNGMLYSLVIAALVFGFVTWLREIVRSLGTILSEIKDYSHPTNVGGFGGSEKIGGFLPHQPLLDDCNFVETQPKKKGSI